MMRRALTFLRDVGIVLALPVLTLAAVGLVLIIWLGRWLPFTQPLRLNYLGAALVLTILILAFGYLRLWNLAPKSLKGKWMGGEAEIEMDDDDDGPGVPPHV